MKTVNRIMPFNGLALTLSFMANGIVLSRAITHSSSWYWALLVTIPLFGTAMYHLAQQKLVLKRRRKGAGIDFNNN